MNRAFGTAIRVRIFTTEIKGPVTPEDSDNGVKSVHGAGCQVVMVPDLLPATPAIRARLPAAAPDLGTVAGWLAALARATVKHSASRLP